jgi:hypothetical protein
VDVSSTEILGFIGASSYLGPTRRGRRLRRKGQIVADSPGPGASFSYEGPGSADSFANEHSNSHEQGSLVTSVRTE